MSAVIMQNMQSWIHGTDYGMPIRVSGLVKITESGSGNIICPNGPAYRTAGDMDAKSGKLWVGGGTEATKWASFGAYEFIDEYWKSYNYNTDPGMEGFLNVSKIAIDPTDVNHVVGGSNGYGIIDFKDQQLVGITDETNSILKPVPGLWTWLCQCHGCGYRH